MPCPNFFKIQGRKSKLKRGRGKESKVIEEYAPLILGSSSG
jgi:hypothetical protein